MQLQQQEAQLRERQIDLLVVTFEQAWRAKGYVEETGFPWPLLLDPDRLLYQAYGMGSGTAKEVMGIHNWWLYLKLMLRGGRIRRPTDDIYQLGGDVLIDPQGLILLHYVGRGPADRPAIENVLQLVTQS